MSDFEMDDGKPWRSDLLHLGILMGLGLLLGAYLIWGTVLITRDGVFYIGVARQFAQDPLGATRRYPVGYPFLLWAAHAVAAAVTRSDSPMHWVYSAQSVTLLCRVLALTPLYLLGRLLVGGRRSFWALLILVVLPYPAQYGSDVLREWPYLLVLGLGFWLLYRALYRRQGWMLALVGLDAGVGYLLRPECEQLLLYALLGLLCISWAEKPARPLSLWRAGSLLAAGFLVPFVPYAYICRTVLPYQLLSIPHAPPVVCSVGGKAASEAPLEFAVRVGEPLDLPIKATDPQAETLTFSLAGVPLGSRPVYEFRIRFTRERFWTASDLEKVLLLSSFSQTCKYRGIAFYAYGQPHARPGLLPVRRFWSRTQDRHFYSANDAEIAALLKASPAGFWTPEDVAFYVFGPNNCPPDTVPVYQFRGPQNEYSWALGSEGDLQTGTVVWYVHLGGAPPAGAKVEGKALRWRPGPGQEGEYQINIIVTDGKQQGCQLVRIRVTPAQGREREDGKGRTEAGGLTAKRPERTRESSNPHFPVAGPSDRGLGPQCAGLGKLPKAVDELVGGLAEDLMVVFLAPWLLGLYYRLRYQAELLERVLVLAVVIVNIALVLSRHFIMTTGEDRRYGLALIALTIFYVPVGLDIMAGWLDRLHAFWRPRWMRRTLPHSFWFHLLVGVGIMVCIPKLLGHARMDKAGYRVIAEWLQQNTRADAVVAVPDSRISFYADREGLPYEQHPEFARADYVVEICGKDLSQAPEGWRQEYAAAINKKKGTLVIYGRASREQ